MGSWVKGIIGLIFLLPSWAHANAEELRTGDLIFVGEGKGEFSKAISEATAPSDSLKFVHVGIIERSESDIQVVEASPEEGVRIISLVNFIEETPEINGVHQFVIKRLTIDFPVEEVLKRTKSYLGEPYDWWYLPDNGKMYCSELVYESFLDSEGNHIFTSQPMNFRSPDGSMPQFWIDLFNELGQEVPEGVPGTNPSDLSKSPFLRTINFADK
ncbi:MAG: hypothetical protein J1E16_08460 [Muribaculaceae bacterium]|nr:hypothetical protein [Muribaculaceae bacterium]